jgi:hypothetical protein
VKKQPGLENQTTLFGNNLFIWFQVKETCISFLNISADCKNVYHEFYIPTILYMYGNVSHIRNTSKTIDNPSKGHKETHIYLTNYDEQKNKPIIHHGSGRRARNHQVLVYHHPFWKKCKFSNAFTKITNFFYSTEALSSNAKQNLVKVCGQRGDER